MNRLGVLAARSRLRLSLSFLAPSLVRPGAGATVQEDGKSEVVIFNRSHYDNVFVVRVHKLASRSVWSLSPRPRCNRARYARS